MTKKAPKLELVKDATLARAKSLRICVISTTIMTCPPPGYSGLEMLAWLQAQGLSRRGHQVVLVAPVGSKPPDGVELHGTTKGEAEQQAYSGYKDRLNNFNVVIDNSWQKWAYMWKMETDAKTPVLGVLHAPCDTMYGSAPPVAFPCFVAISKDQADHASQCWAVVARVAYNGVDPDFYKPPPDLARNGRYLFLARMSQIKGPHIAMDVARKCHVALDLVGDDRLTGEPSLAQRLMKQADGHRIKYVGPVNREKTIVYYASRKALLHMNRHYREPFGLAPVEAQLLGMPVIAFDNGAMRETVKHGETGFIVKTQEEVENLVRSDAVASLKPDACREWASQFSVARMIDRYEELCFEAVETGGW
jgi:glycosyltransferase involved in cell wall biosynthesis